MKHKLIFGLAAAALAFSACDDIDENDRYIPVDRPEPSDKVVLIEEFTGAMCANCPNGAAAVQQIKQTYGDQVIAVSLYPSQMPQLTRPTAVDLRTDIATEIFSAYNGVQRGLPSAMFDRTSYQGNYLQLVPTAWITPVTELLTNSTSPVDITMDCQYDKDSRKLTVDYTVDFVNAYAEDVNFQLYLLENGIVSPQLTTTGMNKEYVNNHVLRAGINGTWGDNLGSAFPLGAKETRTHEITLDAKWIPENCSVVGFLYRSSDRTVLQAAEIHHILKEQN